MTYNPHLFKTLSFDPDKSFEPITNLFFIVQVLAVNSSLNAKTLEELPAVSKAKPNTLSYSSPSLALVLFLENFKRETGADMVRVPFKGGGDAVTGLLSGTTPVVFVGVANLLAHLRSGAATGLVMDSAGAIPNLHYGGDLPVLLEKAREFVRRVQHRLESALHQMLVQEAGLLAMRATSSDLCTTGPGVRRSRV